MKYKIERTNRFTKQYAKMLKQKEFKEEEFIKVLRLLANDEVLPPKYNNHLLTPKSKRHLGMSHTARHITRISTIQKRINLTFTCNRLTCKFIQIKNTVPFSRKTRKENHILFLFHIDNITCCDKIQNIKICVY